MNTLLLRFERKQWVLGIFGSVKCFFKREHVIDFDGMFGTDAEMMAFLRKTKHYTCRCDRCGKRLVADLSTFQFNKDTDVA